MTACWARRWRMGRRRPTSTDRQADLCSLLRSLDLTHAATSFGDLALKAAKAGLTHEAFLYELVRGECEYRAQRRIERDLRRSKLPREKTFATLDLTRFGPPLQLQIERLRAGTFVEEATNSIAVGRPGV